jgi:hypothetical protein
MSLIIVLYMFQPNKGHPQEVHEWDISRLRENGFPTENVNRLKLQLLTTLLSAFRRTPVHIIVG